MERELQLAGNRSLAEHNMRKAPKLTECKDRLIELYQQLNEQTKKFEENKINLGMLFILTWEVECHSLASKGSFVEIHPQFLPNWVTILVGHYFITLCIFHRFLIHLSIFYLFVIMIYHYIYG